MGKHLRQLARTEIAKGELRPGPALLLLTIADRIRDDSDLFAGERTVASWVGRPQSTMRKWRADLIDAGHMKRIGGRPGVAARYELFPPDPEVKPKTKGPGMPDDALERIEAAKEQR